MNPLSFLFNQGRRAVGVVDDFITRDLIRASRAAGPQVRKAVVAGSLPARLNIIARTRPMQAAGALTAVGSTEAVRQALNQQSPAAPGNALDRFVSSIVPDPIERPLMNFAREQEKKGLGGVLEFASPLGFLAAPFIPNTSAAAATGASSRGDVTGRDVPGLQQKRWTLPVDSTPPPAPDLPPPSILNNMTAAPSDRTYEAEKQRVAQMAAQDPLAKKYQVADLTKAYNAAGSPEEKEKIGLQIWATTNPQLAQKLKPGQIGYEEAVSAFTAQTPFAGLQKAAGNMEFTDKFNTGLQALSAQGVNPYQLETPLTGINFQAPSQVGISEKFSDFQPNSMEAYANPLKFLSGFMNMQEAARTKGMFERGLK